MKKHTCKLLSTLLAVIIILSSFVFPVFADTAPVTGKFGDEVNFSFDEKTGTLTLSGKGATWATSDENGGVIDSEYPLAIYREKIKKLVIGEGITSVGMSAFKDCENLAEIIFPKTLTKIGNYSFWNTGITEMNIPEGVTDIGQQAFYGCENLKKASIPSTANYIDGNVFSGCPQLEKVEIKCVCPFIIASGIFSNSASLKEVTVPEGSKVFTLDENGDVYINTETGRTIYQYIPTKEDATYCIADDVKEIHVDSFRGAPNLKAVYIPKSVVKIGGAAFSPDILTDIYYEGSEEDWKKMDIDENLYDRCVVSGNIIQTVKIHYNATPVQMNTEMNKKLSHEFGEWQTVKTATCISEGSIKRVCKKCGETETAATTIDPSNHVNTETIGAVAATCTKDGVSGKVYCKDCKTVVFASYPTPAFGHSMVETPENEATYYADGNNRFFTCVTCKKVYEDRDGKNETTVAAQTVSKKAYIPGDIDDDNKVTAADARLALRASVGFALYVDSSREFAASDVDRDSKITAADARLILRASVGLEELKK